MKEALYYKKENGKTRCLLCPKKCIVAEDHIGYCGVRKNIDGKLYSLVYEKPCSTHVDPIEKKPLYHFFPGSTAFSVGTLGCNLGCGHCQNWEISQGNLESFDFDTVTAEKIVDLALKNGCKIISYTYNEPTVFFEYMLDIAKLARKKGIKNTIVSNGFINQEPLKELLPWIDAANIDLKSFNPNFYKQICLAELEPVLETLKTIKKSAWLEVTNLVIPGKNDNLKEIEEMVLWIKNNLGDTVLHFSRFFPYYKMQDIDPTNPKTLYKARQLAERYLSHVYVGNVQDIDSNSTFCPKCKTQLVKRTGYTTEKPKIENGKCTKCAAEIIGVWE